VNRGKKSPYLLQKHENAISLALKEKTPIISHEASPILQDKGKNSPYLSIQRLLTMKDEKNVCFIYLPLKINTPLLDKYHSQHTNWYNN
jgi:hypothetical protein